MPDHIPEEREVANSADIHRAYELERAFYGPMEPAQRLLTLASRLEAVEKDDYLKECIREIVFCINERFPMPEDKVLHVLSTFSSLVPTLSKE